MNTISVAALDSKVLRVVDEVSGVMLGEDLEIVVLGHIDAAAQRGINMFADALGEAGVGVLLDVDADKWHGQAPWGRGLISR